MKALTLLTLVASLALAITATADSTVYSSKASTGNVLATLTSQAVITAINFDGTRQNTKIQGTSAGNDQITTTDKSVACSKPMDSVTCTSHCPM